MLTNNLYEPALSVAENVVVAFEPVPVVFQVPLGTTIVWSLFRVETSLMLRMVAGYELVALKVILFAPTEVLSDDETAVMLAVGVLKVEVE